MRRYLLNRNLVLFALLIGLLFASYFLVVWHKEQSESEYKRKYSLLDFSRSGEFQSVQSADFLLKRKGESFFVIDSKTWKGRRADQNKVNELFDKLSTIRTVEVVPYKTWHEVGLSHYISAEQSEKNWLEFKFKEEKVRFTLGEKISFSTNFYILVEREGSELSNSELIIATDIAPDETPYPEEIYDRNPGKYRKFLEIFSFKNSSFLNLSLFPTLSLSDVEKISFHFARSSFEIDFKNMKTSPEVHASLSYNKEFIENYLISFIGLKATKLFLDPNNDFLGNVVATVDIQEKKAYQLTLFSNYADLNSFCVKRSDDDALYVLDQVGARILLPQLSDFWTQKLLPFDPTISKESLKFGLVDDQHQVACESENRLLFKINCSQNGQMLNPVYENFSTLLSFLAKRADMVSPLLKSENRSIYGDFLFEFQFEGERIEIFRNLMELQLINHNKKLRYHFLVGDEAPFPENLSDYFLTKSGEIDTLKK